MQRRVKIINTVIFYIQGRVKIIDTVIIGYILLIKTQLLLLLRFIPGSIRSVDIGLHHPDTPVISGKSSNQINVTVTIHHSGSSPVCDPWELLMWISPNGKNDGNSISPKQVIKGKEQYLQLQDGKPAVFEHLTYNANLRNISCDEVQYLCGRFLGLGSNARCSSAVSSCVSIRCKGKTLLQVFSYIIIWVVWSSGSFKYK